MTSAGDVFSQLQWLEPNENPFGMRVLDCRPFCTNMLSVTQDPDIAAKFSVLRQSTGENHRHQRPENAAAVDCRLTYPIDGEKPDGPLFLSDVMEDKWDIYLYDERLYFARSWTGNLVLRAATRIEDGQRLVTAVEANGELLAEEPLLPVRIVDFLIKSHMHRVVAPHPVPRSVPDDERSVALYSFSQFGRWGYFASFDDTTAFRIQPADQQ